MIEFLNMFLDQIGIIIVGGLIVYYFTRLDGKFARLEERMSKSDEKIAELREEMIRGNVVTNLFERHMSDHSHKE